jgi:PPOX class probable F420-dependent enzyme
MTGEGRGVHRPLRADRRSLALSADEVAALLASESVVIVTSIGPRGWPHSMPMWYVPDEDRVSMWTTAKSQKVRNLERDPRATLLVEAGGAYRELRGAMIEAHAEIDRDPAGAAAFAERLVARYPELAQGPLGTADGLDAQVRRRVVLRLTPIRTASWDHRKMGARR